jgi:hypothetical protein
VAWTVVLVDRAFTADDGDSTAEDPAQEHAEQLNTRLGYTEYRKIRCPSIAELPVPSASPVLRLPGDAADRLAAALRAAGPETLADKVRAAICSAARSSRSESTVPDSQHP